MLYLGGRRPAPVPVGRRRASPRVTGETGVRSETGGRARARARPAHPTQPTRAAGQPGPGRRTGAARPRPPGPGSRAYATGPGQSDPGVGVGTRRVGTRGSARTRLPVCPTLLPAQPARWPRAAGRRPADRAARPGYVGIRLPPAARPTARHYRPAGLSAGPRTLRWRRRLVLVRGRLAAKGASWRRPDGIPRRRVIRTGAVERATAESEPTPAGYSSGVSTRWPGPGGPRRADRVGTELPRRRE